MLAVQSILFAGVCAGMLGAGIGTPVDVVKTRIQAKGSAYTEGAVAAARQILREEGTPNANGESSLCFARNSAERETLGAGIQSQD